VKRLRTPVLVCIAAALLGGCGQKTPAAPAGSEQLAMGTAAGLPSVARELLLAIPILRETSKGARRALVDRRRRARRHELRRLARSPSVRAALRHAWLAGALSREGYDADRKTLTQATQAASTLAGVQGAAQRQALGVTQGLAASHGLTAGRLTAAFIQLHRNTTWWSHRGPPAYGRPLIQGRDPVTMKYIPGQGLVVHYLSSWGRVNALARNCSQKPSKCPRARLRQAVDRMLSLGSERDGFLTWESLFHWDGGAPGWISAITQGTALQALARAASVLNSHRFEKEARRALGAFEHPAPVGLSAPAHGGRHYLMYSFAPGLRILNGFLRALTGLRDLSRLDGSHRAFELYKAGVGAAQHEIHKDDTGAWSLYSDGGDEASFGYHRLASGFLSDLCDITHRRDFCSDALRFSAYMTQAPRMSVRVGRRTRAGGRLYVALALSKVSTLDLVLSGPHGPVLVRRFTMARGGRVLKFTAPPRGDYVLSIAARGPSGPQGHAATRLRVLRSAASLDAARRKRAARRQEKS
jgi:hypothetical protein